MSRIAAPVLLAAAVALLPLSAEAQFTIKAGASFASTTTSDFTPDAAARLDVARFSAALTLGRRRFNQAAARFDARHRPDYALIDIGAARAYGIVPIEAVRSEEVRR